MSTPAGFHKVIIHSGRERVHAMLEPIGLAGWYYLHLRQADKRIHPEWPPASIVRYREGVLGIPRDAPRIYLHDDCPEAYWVEHFPHEGDWCRWVPLECPGEWLLPREVARYVSPVIGAPVRAKDVAQAAHSGKVSYLRNRGYASPLIWEGNLPAVVDALRA